MKKFLYDFENVGISSTLTSRPTSLIKTTFLTLPTGGDSNGP
jgi:hypothetical protein